VSITTAVEQEILDRVEEHAFSVTDREVGGILVGQLTESGVRVAGSIPALRARGSQMHVTFTHEVWEDVLSTIDREFAGQQIVGWYHTHPGFGLFLSEYDRFIHENFFSDPRMVALVIDPLAGELGWFGWEGDSLQVREERRTSRRAIARVPVGAATDSRGLSRATALVAVAACSVLGAVGGYLLSEVERQDESVLHEKQLAAVTSQLETARRQLAERQNWLAVTPEARREAASQSGQEVVTSVDYRVRSGDTLWALAESFYGDGKQWRRILRANDARTGSTLALGQVLGIPTQAN
jgi:proteasome lid subunit RPN8/RPN11